MVSFSLFVLGAGGGPLETDISAYLFKPYASGWEEGIFALDAGSGVGTLVQLLSQNNELLKYFAMDSNIDPKVAAYHLVSFIHTYLITHSHFDHISGMVLSGGTLPTVQRKRIVGIESVLRNLELVFSGQLWPKLANRQTEDQKYTYMLTSIPQGPYERLCNNVSVRALPISHGVDADGVGSYESTAFFVRNDRTCREFLFFGDVEPDSLSANPRTKAVWKLAAPMIPHRLTVIFLECSWSLGRPDGQLYGHLSPIHVVEELEVLANEVISLRSSTSNKGEGDVHRKGSLSGVSLYIIHCKEDPCGGSASSIITQQVRCLVAERDLGLEVIEVKQGMCIDIL
ncbi:hypothetical protein M422DRAFT_36794 [Sphaerobolus stellatus SS14]|uniref:3',5'-cyclic-nucleotide phosphodiesterase n=1 Tax=Sphaerobolus stellatus (strain SS14) TaxID=990650 RepID=A0A0C9UX37_SPHS4|nr:hypothetical protein M422DRAFT_36794 [Sphaerobolus stellatus SS14]